MSEMIRGMLAAAVVAPVMMMAAVLPPPDRIPATGGEITIQPINHATLQLAFGGKVIEIDPVAQANFTGLPQPDLILITDIHGDHLDPATVTKRKKAGTVVVAPSAAAARLEQPTVMANGETKTVAGVSIEAVPMYNLTRGPAAGQLYHDKGRGNGYVIALGGKRIYIAGDTECTPEMRALKNIDVAFIPVNIPPGRMTPAAAADCVKTIAPKIVYTYHYDQLQAARYANPRATAEGPAGGLTVVQSLQAFKDALKGEKIEVRDANWYPVAVP